eukprot:CAMPEP_0185031460 /NCGR_PEP_ID=MMETSP1103-20130426/18944_1 /TAXON_ID=36769 /ORGANISM="Paraphysomonas bandaiensis, Strain Caron Lab Isolate" /LENGTH=1209 /DNA_ID=CAMNT_0027566997 /DNA_START=38 /DNA_END=3667 /DNA_ORIENTATION=-
MDQWDSTFEDDLSFKKPINDQIQKSLNFAQEHETLLREIENATRMTIVDTPVGHFKPIHIAAEPLERVYAQDLITTDNPLLNKVLTVIVFLCDEINELQDIASIELFRPLIMFGQQPPGVEVDDEEEYKNDGTVEKSMGAILPHLQKVSNFVDRAYSVSINLVQQLSSLIRDNEQLYRASFQKVHLEKVFLSLGQLLTILITLDNIIDQNDALKHAWVSYKHMISFARSDPSSFNTTESKLSSYEKLLVALDVNIMSREIFKGCIDQNYEINVNENDEETKISVRSNATFLAEMLHCTKSILENALAVIGKSTELNEREHLVGCFGLYVLYRQLVPPTVAPDAKFQKHLWGIQKTIPIVVLSDKVVWYPAEFLMSYAPYELKKPDPPNPAVYRKTFLVQFDSTFSAKVQSLIAQCKNWFILAETRLQASLRHEDNIRKVMDLRGSIVLKGLSLANRAAYLAKYSLVTHGVLQVPMTKSTLLDISSLVEVLKGIEFTFIRKDTEINEARVHMLSLLASACLDIIKPLKSKLESSRRLDAARLDMLTALSVLQTSLTTSESLSYTRQVLLYLSSSMVLGAGQLGEADANKLRAYVKRMSYIGNITRTVREYCDTQYLYHHKDTLFPIAVANIFSTPTSMGSHKLQYLVAAFCYGARSCGSVIHIESEPFVTAYREFLLSVLRREIVEPLCRSIETDLRLHIHTKHLTHMQASNPKTEDQRPLKPYLDIAPVHVLGEVLTIKNEVSHYLDRTFYNLTTVALHDWRTYSDMRSLANEKYGIVLLDNYLPMGSLDQGLDVLQIMRNIHVFVGRFTYNMNTQQFVEFRPDKASKHINTIKIQSIAASLRQHGLGVLNTTVNFTYQFLAQKFNIFSQFLFDDYIKAHLSREYRWYKKHKNLPEVNNKYPYDRALKFVRDIRKLGVNEAGKTFLDQFRILITEIGNALGYVRMVRSASMFYCSEAVKFLPDIDKIISFEKFSGGDQSGEGEAAETDSTGAGLSGETVRAAKNLDSVIRTLVDNFSEGSDYFKVLVNVFQSVLLTSDNDHLKTFFMIVPAMCISWVEASLQAKDAMYKATRHQNREMYFNDDGFAIGLSYCLAILKQTNKYQALHWFDTLGDKHKADLKVLKEQQEARALKEKRKSERRKSTTGFMGGVFGSKKQSDDDDEDEHQDYEEVHSLQMTAKRMEAMRRENDQLFYSMAGAAIFFKRTDVDI